MRLLQGPKPKAATKTLIFFVPGHAKTQGSKRPHFPKTRSGRIIFDERLNPVFTMVDSANWKGGKLDLWKKAVASEALVAVTQNGFGRIPKDVGVTVQFRFIFDRPKKVREGADHISRPDIDKLERAAIDAMAGIVYERDQQICSKISDKDYLRPHDPGIGVVVAITRRKKR